MRASALFLFLAHVALASPSKPLQSGGGGTIKHTTAPGENPILVTTGDSSEWLPRVTILPSAGSNSGPGPSRVNTEPPASAKKLWEGRARTGASSSRSSSSAPSTREAKSPSLPSTTSGVSADKDGPMVQGSSRSSWSPFKSQPGFKGKPVPPVVVSGSVGSIEAKGFSASSTTSGVSADKDGPMAQDFDGMVKWVMDGLRGSPTSMKQELDSMRRKMPHLLAPIFGATVQKIEDAEDHLVKMRTLWTQFLSAKNGKSEMDVFAVYLSMLVHFERYMELIGKALKTTPAEFVVYGNRWDAEARFKVLKSQRVTLETTIKSKVPEIAAYLKLLPSLIQKRFGIKTTDENSLTELVRIINRESNWS